MFSDWMKSCDGKGKCSWDDLRSAQLEFLKWVRDNLKVRLAAVEAAITEIETQIPPPEAEAAETPSTEGAQTGAA